MVVRTGLVLTFPLCFPFLFCFLAGVSYLQGLLPSLDGIFVLGGLVGGGQHVVGAEAGLAAGDFLVGALH